MKAIYAFSGDPITYGHIDIIERAAATYDHVSVGIGANPNKIQGYLFSAEERLEMAKQAVAHFKDVDALIFQGLLAQFAYRNGYHVIIRGVRNTSDLESELTLYNVNQLQFSTIDTVFFPTRPTLSHVSSSVVKALVREGGDVSNYVPIFVKQKLEQKINRQIRSGMTGGIGAGKSFTAGCLVRHIPHTRHIDLDQIGHYILSNSPEPAYRETRKRIAERFGKQILDKDGSINRSALGTIAFQHPGRLKKLNEILLKPLLANLYELCLDNDQPDAADAPDELHIIFLETGLFVESRLTHLVNHCLILVTSPEDLKIRRLVDSLDMNEDEARQKIRREISDRERRGYWKEMLEYNHNSFLIEFENREEAIPDSFIEEVRAHINKLSQA